MEIKFYTTKSEFNRLEKTLENEITLEGNFKNEVDIMAPIICVKNTSIAGANYVHIPDLDRYYFIDKIEITRTQLLTVFLSLDVLMSYKEEIKKYASEFDIDISNTKNANEARSIIKENIKASGNE